MYKFSQIYIDTKKGNFRNRCKSFFNQENLKINKKTNLEFFQYN